MTPEQQRYLESRPINRLRQFASMLHWHGLQLNYLLITPDTPGFDNTDDPLIVWFATPQWKFCLHINERSGHDAPLTHCAAVVPFGYGLRPDVFQSFTLFDDPHQLAAEADRLRPLLDRRYWRRKSWRQSFLLAHPELRIPTKKRRGAPLRSAILRKYQM